MKPSTIFLVIDEIKTVLGKFEPSLLHAKDSSIADKVAALKLTVSEQKRDYDFLLRIYERAGAKESVLLTATFGVIAYLFHDLPDLDKNGKKISIAKRLFIPDQDYGKVIYFIAASFFLYALFKLVLNVFGGSLWETAYESSKNDYSKEPLKNLEYVKGRYDEVHKTNLKSYVKRRDDLTFCFYCISVSGIMLIVIKVLQ